MADAEGEDSAVATARCIIDMNDIVDPHLAKLKIGLRDVFLIQLMHGEPVSKIELDAALAGHFGVGYTQKLKSQLFLAYHHVTFGKRSPGRSRRRKPRRRILQVVFRALTGETHQTAVEKGSLVGDMQEAVCALFDQPYPGTKVTFVANEIVYDDAAAQPFRTLATRAEVRVIFNWQVHVLLTKMNGETCEIIVDPRTSLRELQHTVCKLFHQRFPATKATLIVGECVYDEFIQSPFMHCVGAVAATVTFAPTDDPYFYDLRDRRPGQMRVRNELPAMLRLP